MRLKRILCACLMAVASIGSMVAGDVYEGHEITPEGAWCWFADPRAIHYESPDGSINSSYIGYIDVHGSIKAMQYDFKTGVRSEVLIRSYFQPDDHDNPTFLVLPDERVMIFYSRHTDEACFYYRISQKKGDITTLGEEKKIVTKNNTTYPSPFILSDDPTHIYLCWRGINWHPTIAKLSLPDAQDNVDVEWGPYQMVQSTGARPYAKYQSNGKDKILVSYTTGHPDNEQPNYLYFNYININSLTLEDVKGNTLSTIANGAFNVSKTTSYVNSYPLTVVDQTSGIRDWLWQVVECPDSNPAIAMVKISGGKTSHDYYYAKWDGNEWKKTFLINAGGAFHQTANLEMCYSGGMAIDPANTNVIYCSAPVQGDNGKVYEILKLTVNDDGTVTQEAVTKNSTLGNSRPYILPGSDKSPLRLAWMHGNYYDWIVSKSRAGYPTALHCDYDYTPQSVSLEDGLIKAFTFDSDEGIKKATTKDGVLVLSGKTLDTKADIAKGQDFSVSLSPYISETAYYGTILTVGDIEYGLSADDMKPYVKIGDVTYKSTNKLATADCWTLYDRGTNGKWYDPSKLKYFNLTVTVADGTLTTYVNGLIDQRIELASGAKAYGDVEIGGYTGWMEDCRIYSKALNQEEIKALTKTSTTYTLSDDLKAEGELSSLSVPSDVYADIYLPATSKTGLTVTWTSSDAAVLPATGLVSQPDTDVPVTLTATIGSVSKSFETVVHPRDIDKCEQIRYDFESEDLYDKDGVRYVQDKSGNGRDAAVMGSAKVEGTLDLTANTASAFSTNGYALAPQGSLETLRSYTFFLKVNPTNLNKAPRLYDFGSGAYNSVFGRGKNLTAGVKYNGGSTAMVNSSVQLQTGTETCLAFTYDAKTKKTMIYVNGASKGSGTNITYSPCQLLEIGQDVRNYIGRAQWWDTSEAANNIDYCGTIDDFRVYNTALTADEIKALCALVTSVKSVEKDSESALSPVICSPSESVTLTAGESASAAKGGAKVLVTTLGGATIASYTAESGTCTFKAPAASGYYLVSFVKGGKRQATHKLIVR